jgi:hypothetical protein
MSATATTGEGGNTTESGAFLMSDLMALALAALPFVLFVLLIVETFRDRPTAADGLPVDLFHRSFGA